jgi:Flp pilus assembly protein TadD
MVGALVLAPLGLVGCYGADEESDADEAPTVLTPQAEAEYTQTIDESRQLLDKGDAQKSLAALERSAQLNPDGFAVHNNYCVAYGILQLRDQAVAECQRAVELDPNSQLAKNNLNWVSGIKPAPVPE